MKKTKDSVLKIEEVDLSKYDLMPHLLKRIPEQFIWKYKVLPFKETEEVLEIVISDAFQVSLVEDLEEITGKKVVVKKAPTHQIEKKINTYFQVTKTKEIIEQVEKNLVEEKKVKKGETVDPRIETSLTVKLVDHILLQAVQKAASDIHIEAMKTRGRVRYRIDGYLQEEAFIPLEEMPHVLTRIKILSRLNIAEKRIPQDGRMELLVGGYSVDMRVSILPTLYGEKVTIRLVYNRDFNLTIENLGFIEEDYKRFRKLTKKNNGILLVTGPTGSGKSTTLATILK